MIKVGYAPRYTPGSTCWKRNGGVSGGSIRFLMSMSGTERAFHDSTRSMSAPAVAGAAPWRQPLPRWRRLGGYARAARVSIERRLSRARRRRRPAVDKFGAFGVADVRVGVVRRVWRHPAIRTATVQDIDVGDGEAGGEPAWRRVITFYDGCVALPTLVVRRVAVAASAPPPA